jgi:hypothetical protein
VRVSILAPERTPILEAFATDEPSGTRRNRTSHDLRGTPRCVAQDARASHAPDDAIT